MLKKSIIYSVEVLFFVVFLLFSGCSAARTSNSTETSLSINTSTTNTTHSTNKTTTPSPESENNSVTEPSKTSVSSIPSPERKTTKNVDSKIDEKSIVSALYNDFYIGESFKSGFIYIEPFKVERTSYYKEFKFDNHPNSTYFYTINGSNNAYNSVFDSESSVYIPSVEEDSQYYWQGDSEPNQFTLRYKSSNGINDTSVGVAFFNHKILKIDFTNKDKKRVYSKDEYNNALDEVKKGKEDKEDMGGALSEITLDNTIVGAQEICLINLEGINLKMLLSKYLYIGFENTADVYVIDFINTDGKVVDTFQKYNWSAY